MPTHNRRKQFLINKPLQFRYGFYIMLTLYVVCGTGLIGSYYSLWASAQRVFSRAATHNRLLNAAQIYEYLEARNNPSLKTANTLRNFKGADLLSARDRELIKQIMRETTKRMTWLGCFLVILIGWGSIYLTHKVAGPIFKLRQMLTRLKDKDLTVRIHFRKYDEVQNIAREFNEMASSLDQTVGRLKEIASKDGETGSNIQSIQEELDQFHTTSN